MRTANSCRFISNSQPVGTNPTTCGSAGWQRCRMDQPRDAGWISQGAANSGSNSMGTQSPALFRRPQCSTDSAGQPSHPHLVRAPLLSVRLHVLVVGPEEGPCLAASVAAGHVACGSGGLTGECWVGLRPFRQRALVHTWAGHVRPLHSQYKPPRQASSDPSIPHSHPRKPHWHTCTGVAQRSVVNSSAGS